MASGSWRYEGCCLELKRQTVSPIKTSSNLADPITDQPVFPPAPMPFKPKIFHEHFACDHSTRLRCRRYSCMPNRYGFHIGCMPYDCSPQPFRSKLCNLDKVSRHSLSPISEMPLRLLRLCPSTPRMSCHHG
jgi:hypothetical protein